MIEGELEEIKAELEENRRKLINLKMQKDAACEGHATSPTKANGSLSPEKPADKTKLRELKDSIDEIKVLTFSKVVHDFIILCFVLTCKLSTCFK